MKGRPRKLKQWNPRMTLSIPLELQQRLLEYEEEHPGKLNRSRIACRAFEDFLKKEENGVSDWEVIMERLGRIERILKRRSNLET